MEIKIAPSLLSADFTCLGEEIRKVEAAGADLLHLDIMDGHFVPNITFGPPLVASIRPVTRLFLEAHLMVENPDKFIAAFHQAGADRIIIHAEALPNFPAILKSIRRLGISNGASLKPQTPLDILLPHMTLLDSILFMTVEPGFGGQAFMPEVLPKIKASRDWISKHDLTIDLEVDGGIAPDTAASVIAAGANILIAGSAIFGKPDPAKIIAQMRQAANTPP